MCDNFIDVFITLIWIEITMLLFKFDNFFDMKYAEKGGYVTSYIGDLKTKVNKDYKVYLRQ